MGMYKERPCKYCGQVVTFSNQRPCNPDMSDHRETCTVFPPEYRKEIRDRNHDIEVARFLRRAAQ